MQTKMRARRWSPRGEDNAAEGEESAEGADTEAEDNASQPIFEL